MSKLKYKVISTLEQYTEYCDIHEKLAFSGNDSVIDELNLLELLIEDYNKNIMKEFDLELDPVQLLKLILKENQISQVELADKIDISPQFVNDILKYRRDINKNLAYKLAEEFAMDVGAFIRPYKLKIAG